MDSVWFEMSEETRLNILLSKNSTIKLDKMVKRTGFRSRGKTIEVLIENFWEMSKNSKQLMEMLEKNTDSDLTTFKTKVMLEVIDILKRLYRFEE